MRCAQAGPEHLRGAAEGGRGGRGRRVRRGQQRGGQEGRAIGRLRNGKLVGLDFPCVHEVLCNESSVFLAARVSGSGLIPLSL